MSSFKLLRINPQMNIDNFDCGPKGEKVTAYFRKRALYEDSVGLASVHCIVPEASPDQVAAFFSICCAETPKPSHLDLSLSDDFSGRGIPIFEIAWLGKSASYHREVFGNDKLTMLQLILASAIRVCEKSNIGGVGLFLDAKNQDLLNYYLRDSVFGQFFRPEGFRLFITDWP